LGVGFVDSHLHLDLSLFDEDRDSVVSRARQANVLAMLNPGHNLESSRKAIQLAERYPELYAAVGVHPHDAAAEDPGADEAIRELARNPRAAVPQASRRHPLVVAIGEIGLDYYRNLSPPDTQRRVFLKYLHLARELNLPVIVHCRDAFQDVCGMLEEIQAGTPAIQEEKSQTHGSEGASPAFPGIRGVLHSFSGDESSALRLLDIGFFLSFSGQITYPKSDSLRSIARELPIEKMLIETDSPFLTPKPQRGKRNEPSFVRHIAEELARLKGLTVEDVARITTGNVRRLFGIGPDIETGQIAYRIRNSLYLNITNECTNACVFCRRQTNPVVKGHDLRLEKEPTVEEITAAIGEHSGCDEIVFCGYGEPLLRLDAVKQVAQFLTAKADAVGTPAVLRVNTNGLANLAHGRNIVPELLPLIRTFSISLNASTAEEYHRLCRSRYGPAAYEEVKRFIRECRQGGASVIATVVAVPGLDIEACRKVAEEELGVPLRVRDYDDVG
jgi:TatD DNase family protein